MNTHKTEDHCSERLMSIIKESHHTSGSDAGICIDIWCFNLLCIAIQGYFMYAYTFRLNLFFYPDIYIFHTYV